MVPQSSTSIGSFTYICACLVSAKRFTLHFRDKGYLAKEVRKVENARKSNAHELGNHEWPASLLEPSIDGADIARCRQYESNYADIVALKGRALKGLLERSPQLQEYLSKVESFQAQQEKLLEMDGSEIAIQNKNGVCRAQHTLKQLAKRAARYKKAWHFLKDCSFPLTVSDICKTHSEILGDHACRGAPGFRDREVTVERHTMLPHSEVPWALTMYAEALSKVIAREDLSGFAKAAWAGHQLLVIYPFANCNGRLARLIINRVLKHCGVPFFLILGSPEHRLAWQKTFRLGLDGGSTQPLAELIARVAVKSWTDLDEAAETAATCRHDSAQEDLAKKVRSRAKEEMCSICFEGDTDISVLCCSAVYHQSCLCRWLTSATQPACVSCRKEINADSIRKQSSNDAADRGNPFRRVIYVSDPSTANMTRSISAAVMQGRRQTWLEAGSRRRMPETTNSGPSTTLPNTPAGGVILTYMGNDVVREQDFRARLLNTAVGSEAQAQAGQLVALLVGDGTGPQTSASGLLMSSVMSAPSLPPRSRGPPRAPFSMGL